MMDLLLPSADLALLERAVSREFELFWGKNMVELSAISFEEMREFTHEFRELIYEMPFQVPQNVIFLGRCVGILSGMCTGLDPRFNIWEHLSPYAKKLMAEEARINPEVWLAELEKLVRSFLLVPQKMDSLLSKLEQGEVAVRTPEVTQQVGRLEGALRQVTGGIIFSALVLGGIQLYLGGEIIFSSVLLAAAGINVIWLLLYNRK